MTVVVADTGTDQRDARTESSEQLRTRSTGAAVMPHLQDVPAPSVVGEDLQQLVLAILLEVTRQQGPLPAERQRQHDRCVVDGATGVRGDGRQPDERRPEDVDASGAQPEGLTLRHPHARDAMSFGSRS
jgi:hypothetical protein